MTITLELSTRTAVRLVEDGVVRAVSIGDRVPVTDDPLHLHQGLDRPTPPGLAAAARRLELDDDAVTWGVSQGHCRIWRDALTAHVLDCNADNGTFVTRAGNIRRVDGSETFPIQPNDRITVDRIELILRTRSAP